MNSIIAQIIGAEIHTFRGRLGQDPECRSFESGSYVAKARMAVPLADKKRDDPREDYWFTLEAWGKSDEENTPASFMLNSCRKGQEVEVKGRVKTDTYTDRNNETKTSVVIKVVDIFLLSSSATPPAPTTAQPRTPAQSRPPAPTPSPAAWLTSNSDGPDEEVPF